MNMTNITNMENIMNMTNITNMENINKCPKCGNTPKVYGWANMYSGGMRDVKISCDHCDIQTKHYGTYEDAVEVWNSITDNYPNNQNTVYEK